MCSSPVRKVWRSTAVSRVWSASPITGFQASFTGVQSPICTRPVASELLRLRPCTCVFGVWVGHGVICLNASQVPPSSNLESGERCQGLREISGGYTPAFPLLISLLFYQAFRSWPSAPHRLICQTGFHLHLQDATNLPFMPPPLPTGQFVKMAASHPHHCAQ